MQQRIFTAGSLEVADWGLDFHELMLGDVLRMDAYKQAIFEAVKSGMVICEIGVGTGILSKWALEAGARVVYGIEINKGILDVAIENLKEFGSGFVPLLGLSYDISLPEKVDVIISEILGNIADNENFSPILQDAKNRFLKTDGEMLPLEVDSYFVPVCAEEAHQNILKRNIEPTHSDSLLINKMSKMEISHLFNFYFDSIIPRSGYLAQPNILQHFDKNNLDEFYEKHLQFKIVKGGNFTGFKGWFDAKLSQTVHLNIESEAQYSDSWKHAYFPVEKTIEVISDDIISVNFCRIEDNKYRWEGTVQRGGQIIGNFNQKIL